MAEYIERDKLLDAVFELPPKMAAQGYGWIARGGLYQLIRDFQSADVTPVVHGKNLNEEWPSLFECSICHWSCWDTYCGDTDTYNYCPNCGARMDGEA